MGFVESRILGIKIDESGREVVLSLIDTDGAKFTVQLHGVERLLVNEVRQQNIIEELTHWARVGESESLREAAFALMTGVNEKECGAELAAVALNVVDRVVRGELEVVEITAVFGAQILASFASMAVQAAGER